MPSPEAIKLRVEQIDRSIAQFIDIRKLITKLPSNSQEMLPRLISIEDRLVSEQNLVQAGQAYADMVKVDTALDELEEVLSTDAPDVSRVKYFLFNVENVLSVAQRIVPGCRPW